MGLPEELVDKIRGLSNLPTLPSAANRLIEAVNDPQISVRNVGRIISHDPSLTAKVIRLANSSYYGLPRRITNVEDAAVVLGLRVIQTLVLSLTVFDSFPGSVSREYRRRFWQHSLRTAVASKLIAERMEVPGFNPDDAFCAGLMHDLGKIAMEQYLHADLERVLAVCHQAKDLSFYDAEVRILGYAHTDVFEWMTESWNLPDALFIPGRFHHEPQHAPNGAPAAAVCHLADYLAHLIEAESDTSSAIPILKSGITEKLGLTEESLGILREDIPDVLEQMKTFVDLMSEA